MRKTVGLFRRFTQWLESGERTPEQLLEACLRRIREADPELMAWVEVSPQKPLGDGPLRGLPFGAKDIFETRGLATEFGSPVYAGRKGETDGALVVDLRRQGAVLLGKTHTTAFAYFDPAPTRNPRDTRHTPGGSSSGSAVAVAAGMAPFALGTQTQGSILRPASFCGVVGFKPTFGVLPLEGVLPFAPSLDTAGLFTHTADDMRLLWERMDFPVTGGSARRLGVPAGISGVDGEMRRIFEACVARLPVETIELPSDFVKLAASVSLINDYEGARTHRQRWEEFGERLGARLAELVRRGLSIPESEYLAALDTVRRVRREMADVFREYSVIVTPAALGPAPLGLSSTGDPAMNSPWTGLGSPAISIPMPVSKGLPMGLQLVAAPGADAMLLNTAAEVEDQLD